jgi:hypothetical protein
MDIGFAPKKMALDADNYIGLVQKPTGMPENVFHQIISAQVHSGQPINAGALQAAVDKAAANWVASHKQQFDPGNVILANTAVAGAKQEGLFEHLIKDDIVDATLDSTIDAIGNLSGFQCHDKHARGIIRNTIKHAKADAKDLFSDPAMQKTGAKFIVSGASALANGDISKLEESAKAITAAIKGLDPQARKQLDTLVQKGDATNAAALLHDHDMTGQLHNMSRADFVRKTEHRYERINEHKYFDHMFDQHQHPAPAAGHRHYDKLAMSPPVDAPAAAKPAAPTATAAVKAKPAMTNKYAGLATTPGMMMGV